MISHVPPGGNVVPLAIPARGPLFTLYLNHVPSDDELPLFGKVILALRDAGLGPESIVLTHD